MGNCHVKETGPTGWGGWGGMGGDGVGMKEGRGWDVYGVCMGVDGWGMGCGWVCLGVDGWGWLEMMPRNVEPSKKPVVPGKAAKGGSRAGGAGRRG